jgi:diguanylate cyclase (GGDEF)-like protein
MMLPAHGSGVPDEVPDPRADATPELSDRSESVLLRSRAWNVAVRLFSSTPLDFDEERKRLLFGPVVLLASVLLVLYGANHLNAGTIGEGLVDLTTASALVLSLLWLRTLEDGRIVYRGAVVIIAALFIYFGTLNEHGYRVFWTFTYPVFALFVTGAWFGTTLSLAVLVGWLATIHLPAGMTGISDLPPGFSARFVTAYGTILILALFVEGARRMYAEAMREQQQSLKLANLNLTISRERLRKLAMVDALTRIANRRAIREHLEAELDRAGRASSPVSVALLDIDRFKTVNDTHGHGVGDEVLKECARRIAGSLRSYDRVGRYGGEEFLLVLSETDTLQASQVLERVRHRVADHPIQNGGHPLSITVSIGTATWDGTVDPDTLIDLADRALYGAKRAGRDRIVHHG